MERKDIGILLIAVLFIVLFFTNIIEANGATIYGGTNPGKALENEENWYYGYPVELMDTIYEAKNDTDINIYGNVKLTGSLGLRNWGNLNLQQNSLFIIDGDLYISDECDINLYNGSTLYITGDLHVLSESNYDYVMFNMYNNSNVIVCGDVETENGSDIWVYPSDNSSNPSSDFYVFNDDENTQSIIKRYSGTNWGGNAKLTDGSSLIDDYEQYLTNEPVLLATVDNISIEIDDANCKTLSIPAGSTYVISGDETYCYVQLEEPYIDYNNGNKAYSAGKLIIERGGKLTLTENNTISSGAIENHGTIYCGENDFSIIPFINYNTNLPQCEFKNDGTFIANNFTLGNNDKRASETYFSFSCNSIFSINSDFTLYLNGGASLNGDYNASNINIDAQNGGNLINFGGNCGASNIVADVLSLKADNATINIKELTNVAEVYLQTSLKFNVDGSLTIGKISAANGYEALGIDANENSIIRFCYNPTTGADFGGQGKGTSSNGKVIYRVSGDDEYYWKNGSTPKSENDISGNPTLIANSVSFDECMQNISNFLPITLTYFKIDGNQFIWETASEENNNFFVVEYSKNGTDWRECTKHIKSESNTGWVYYCDVPENTKYSQFSYYRLKQVDIDGKYSYSDILSTSWKVNPPEQDYDFSTSKAFINVEGKTIYRSYNQLPAGTYIEKSENGIRKVVKIK